MGAPGDLAAQVRPGRTLSAAAREQLVSARRLEPRLANARLPLGHAAPTIPSDRGRVPWPRPSPPGPSVASARPLLAHAAPTTPSVRRRVPWSRPPPRRPVSLRRARGEAPAPVPPSGNVVRSAVARRRPTRADPDQRDVRGVEISAGRRAVAADRRRSGGRRPTRGTATPSDSPTVVEVQRTSTSIKCTRASERSIRRCH